MWRILVVDHEPNARTALAELLADEGFDTSVASDGFAALQQIDELLPDLVLCDLRMPRMDGIELLERVAERPLRPAFVVMSAYGSVDKAVTALRLGADNYVQKPINFEELSTVIGRALEKQCLRMEAYRLRERLRDPNRFQGIVGRSTPLREVFEAVALAALSRASVLVVGPSGAGKSLVARALHDLGPRASGPFVTLSCSALSEASMETELFGHESGSLVGSKVRPAGKFQAAHGGTLFLDEISKIPMSTQAKLLRFMGNRQFDRVDSGRSVPGDVQVDVRIVATTNRDIKEEVGANRFREDLYYRLSTTTVNVPSLADRRSDIPLLVEHFVERYAAKNHKVITGVDDTTLSMLMSYPWPGNVRELQEIIERAVVLCDEETLGVHYLPAELRNTSFGATPVQIPGVSLGELEKFAILKTLASTGGSTSRAANILQISPRTIQYRLKRYREAGAPAAISNETD